MRGVESLSSVRVTEVSASAALCARVNLKKHVKSYNTAKFDSLKDALLAAPGMRTVIGFYIFGASLQNFVQSTKSKETYTTVRFSFRKDTLLAAPGMRPVIEFHSFESCKRRS